MLYQTQGVHRTLKRRHNNCNRIRIILLLAIFIFPASVCHAATSGQLQAKHTRHGSTLITEYYDSSGHLTLTDDLKYARIEQQLDDSGRVIKEMYYDESGKPAELYAGHCGLKREYDKQGRPKLYTYLDARGKPMMTKSGYCKIKYSYNLTTGQLDREMYLDVNGVPATSTIGAFGYAYRKYNEQDRAEELVCLNRDGKPCLNKQGYGITRRTFDSEGNLAREMYYDLDGNQVKLAKGQYGISYKDGSIEAYLDKDGNEMFILADFLIENLWVVVICTILLLLLSIVIPRNANVALLLLYVGFILYMTLINREAVVNNLETELFWSYRQWFEDPGLRNEIVENMLLFMPFGFIGGRLVSESCHISAAKRVLIVGAAAFLLSTGIELTQYFTSLGLCELDDIISNSIGGFAGAVLAICIGHIKCKPHNNN